MNNTIGIIGGGFVGSATAWAFRPTHEVRVYDCEPKARTHSFEEVANCDFIFVCVPTPPNHDWTVDLSIVEKVLSDLKELIKNLLFNTPEKLRLFQLHLHAKHQDKLEVV